MSGEKSNRKNVAAKILPAAHQRGLEGNPWFGLIAKAWSERTRGLTWEKAKSSTGAGGVDGITPGHLDQEPPVQPATHHRLVTPTRMKTRPQDARGTVT